MTAPEPPRDEQNRRLVEAAREAIARRDRALDGETLSRLRRMRAEAVRRPRARTPLWLPAGAAVAAALVVALLWPRAPQPELEMLAAGEWLLDEEMEIEVIEEMEFYQWLAEEGLGEHSS